MGTIPENEWLALAERCEAASGPDRETDCRIRCAINGEDFDTYRAVVPALGQWMTPAYTASIDSAMTLVPVPQSFVISHCGNTVAHVQLIGGDPCSDDPEFTGRAATPALALCAAALKARASGGVK